MNQRINIDIVSVFEPLAARIGLGLYRQHAPVDKLDGTVSVHDCVGLGLPVCLTHVSSVPMLWTAPADYAVAAAAGGGLLVTGRQADAPQYWLPLAPRHVLRDPQGRLLRVEPAQLAEFSMSGAGLQVGFAPGELSIETVVWQLPPGCAPKPPSSLERAAWYTL